VKADVHLTDKTRVLFMTHQLARWKYGGVETQMIKTVETINSLSSEFQCSLFHPWEDNVEDFDIAHIFNPRAFPIESLYIGDFVKSRNLKLVTTPIFYHRSNISNQNGGGFAPMLIEKASGDFRRLLKMRQFAFADPYNHVGQLLKRSDLVLPNTTDELNLLLEFFDLPRERVMLVPNATDLAFADGDPKLAELAFGVKDYVLFVGRIEPQKNILRLIKAFKDARLDTKLIIVGKTIDQRYADLCRSEANEDVVFFGEIGHDSDLLRAAYKAAKVVALPSYYETPGLVGLEGGLAGANIVITEHGGPKEYFGDLAHYVNPSSTESISKALVAAYNSPRNSALSSVIAMKYSWEAVAKKTLEAYRSLPKG
jgi:glycosyltransferase involved in cell wall biosynthesis